MSTQPEMAVARLGCVAGAVTATLGLIVGIVLGRGWAVVLATIAGVAFVLWWFVLPFRRR